MLTVPNDDGTVDIEGKLAIVPRVYAGTVGLKATYSTLQKYIAEAGLTPVPNVYVLAKGKPGEAYWKDEVDPLVPKRLNEQGEVEINGRIAVGLSAYGILHKIPFDSMTAHITKVGLKPVENVRVISGRSKTIDVYWKEEVEQAIPKKLNDKGIVTIEGIEAVGLTAYGASFGIGNTSMAKWAEEAGLGPLPNVRVKGGVVDVKVYVRSEVDAVLRNKRKIPAGGATDTGS